MSMKPMLSEIQVKLFKLKKRRNSTNCLKTTEIKLQGINTYVHT